MDKNRKTLKEWGMLLLVFAILDLLTIISSFIGEAGIFKVINAQNDETIKEFGNIVVVAILVIMAIILLLKVFIGAKGVLISKNPSDATGHITLAKFLLVLNVIASISTIASLGENGINAMSMLDVGVCISEVMITFMFIKTAKAVRQDVVGSLRS